MSPTARSIAPDSTVVGFAHRLSMARGAASLAGRHDRASGAIRAAIRDVALGRIPTEERAWIDRIEVARRRISAGLDSPEAVRWMSLPPVWGRFLTRLVRELEPRSCLELGTGFGISTAYQAAALELNDSGSIVSFDVDDMIAIAAPAIERVGLAHRVDLVAGQIERTLDGAVARAAPVDFAFVDHDHTEQGSLNAFDAIRPHLAGGAVVVFDDIAWTDEMRRAWSAIGGHTGVGATLGLGRLGIAQLEPVDA